ICKSAFDGVTNFALQAVSRLQVGAPFRRGLTQSKRLPDIAPSDAVVFNRRMETFDRFGHTFASEREGFEMDWQKMFCTGVVRHLHGLFRRAMRLNPRLVSADGHDGQFKRAFASQRAE